MVPLAVVLTLAAPRLVNITVDDAKADPLTGIEFVYFPPDHWAQGYGCETCFAHPDPTQVYDTTWHDATFDPTTANLSVIQTAMFSFNGPSSNRRNGELDCH